MNIVDAIGVLESQLEDNDYVIVASTLTDHKKTKNITRVFIDDIALVQRTLGNNGRYRVDFSLDISDAKDDFNKVKELAMVVDDLKNNVLVPAGGLYDMYYVRGRVTTQALTVAATLLFDED